MATFFSTFPMPQTQIPLQIIPYNGPPEPMQTSRRIPVNKVLVPSHKDEYPGLDEILGIEPDSDTEGRKKEDSSHTSHGVEVVDLTCSASEGNSEKSGDGGRRSGDVGTDDMFSLKNERESVVFKQIISTQTYQDTGDKSSDSPAPSEGSSQENAVVIGDSLPDLDTDEGDLYEDDTGTQIGDQLEVSSLSSPECCVRGCSTGTVGATSSEAVDVAQTQVSGLLRQLSSTPPISSAIMRIEQPAQEASGHILLKSTRHQSQQTARREAEREGKLPTIERTSSSSTTTTTSGSDNDDDDSSNHTTGLNHKRKRSPSPTRGHIQTLNTTSKQRAKHAAREARRRKPSPSCGKPFSNRPSAPRPLSGARYSGHDANTYCSDDTNDGSSDGSSDDSSDDMKNHVRHLGSNRQRMSTVRPYRSHKQKQKRNRGTADEEDEEDEDDEYEVEEILNARVYRRKLQYRVKWLGYEDDRKWYDAANFKNSPHKLRSFHTANPILGPPKRLGVWVQCWLDERDADDHPDDNKSEE